MQKHFEALSDYVDKNLCGKIISVKVKDEIHFMNYPMALHNPKYGRNTLLFSFGFILDVCKLSEKQDNKREGMTLSLTSGGSKSTLGSIYHSSSSISNGRTSKSSSSSSSSSSINDKSDSIDRADSDDDGNDGIDDDYPLASTPSPMQKGVRKEDDEPFERVLQKISQCFLSAGMEEEFLFQKENRRLALPKILKTIFRDIKSKGETFVHIADGVSLTSSVNTMPIKLFRSPNYAPAEVFDYDVPMQRYQSAALSRLPWDIALVQIIPRIDNVSNVKKVRNFWVYTEVKISGHLFCMCQIPSPYTASNVK